MKKIAAIDIGTNSVLYSLFGVTRHRDIREIHFERHSPRIGGRMAGRRTPTITPENYANLKKILVRHVSHAITDGADDILIAATNPLRLAKNGRKIRQQLQLDLGHHVAILSPDREAWLSFLGAAGRLGKNEKAIVIDMGGGSTEFVVYRGKRRLAFISVPEGAVSLTEKFGTQNGVKSEDSGKFEDVISRYKKRIQMLAPHMDAPVYLVGGTSTALAYLKDEAVFRKRRGVVLTRRDIARFVNMLAGLSLPCRRQLLAVDKKRAEIIFAGAFWCQYVFKILDIKKARATPWGLRHGMAIDFLMRESDSP